MNIPAIILCTEIRRFPFNWEFGINSFKAVATSKPDKNAFKIPFKTGVEYFNMKT